MLALREDLNLSESSSSGQGERVWLLQDAINNRFFKLGSQEVKILALIKGLTIDPRELDKLVDNLLEKVGEKTNRDHVKDFLVFLKQNNLLLASGLESRAALMSQRNHLQPGLFRKFLRNYLFLRFHLLSPNRLLDMLLPLVRWAFHPVFWLLIALNTVFGVYLTSRQWDLFRSSFVEYFTLEGLLVGVLAIAVAKILHELGHALVARRFGCSVDSMGFALLVFWPVLYTDTTDAWRLKDHRHRVLISSAGVLVELVIASLCLTLWNFVDDGILRSAFFILATTTWLLTLAINLNPLMRFDGYFLLSDMLGVENLQSRSFALAKWRLREWLFGYRSSPPERPRPGLIIFAFATWIYRFLLFLGIALIIYNYFFKLLGLFLVALHLVNSLAKPMWVELKFWWSHRDKAKWFPNVLCVFILLGCVVLWLLIPAERNIRLPAFHQVSESSTIYSQEPGRLLAYIDRDGAAVEAGDVLVEMELPDLRYQMDQLARDIELLAARLAGQGVGSNPIVPRAALIAEIRSARQRQEELQESLNHSIITAPFKGVVRSINTELNTNQWLAAGESLMTLVQPQEQEVVAYISERNYNRINVGQVARFYSDGGVQDPIELELLRRDDYALELLDELYAASSHGGGLTVRNVPGGTLMPQESTYRLYFRPQDALLPRVLRGTVVINTEAVSPLALYLRSLLSLWRRESGF